MSAEVRELLSYLGAFGAGAVIAGVVVFLLLKSFLPSYLAEKGKNLATREDIAEITDKIEKVKSGYALILEELKAHHQLRLAALLPDRVERGALVEDAMRRYVERLEHYCRGAPFNWFNFYDYWS